MNQMPCSKCGAHGVNISSCPFNNHSNNIKLKEHNDMPIYTPIYTQTTTTKKRKNCDYQWTELIMCIYILDNTLNDKQKIMDNKLLILNDDRFIYNPNVIEKYFIDLNMASEKEISIYLRHIHTDLIPTSFNKIYLTGKYSSGKSFVPIHTLIEDNNLNSKQKKSDIYIECNIDDTCTSHAYIGVSIKQSSQCFLTNYSTEKLAKKNNLNDKARKSMEYRIKIVSSSMEHGWDTLSPQDKKEKYKTKRLDINAVFSKNKISPALEYWKIQEDIINDTTIQQKIIEGLYPNVTFKSIEYDGNVWSTIPSYKDIQYRFQRWEQNDTDNSAKIWYLISINDTLKYKMDIRGKNPLFMGSMQALIVKLNKKDYEKITNHNILP